MFKLRALFGLVILLGVFAPEAKAQRGDVSFILINKTGRVLEAFYASPANTREWEDDILGVDVLPPGESVEIQIQDGRDECNYDFQGMLSASDDGSVGEGSLIQSNVDICDLETYEYFDN